MRISELTILREEPIFSAARARIHPQQLSSRLAEGVGAQIQFRSSDEKALILALVEFAKARGCWREFTASEFHDFAVARSFGDLDLSIALKYNWIIADKHPKCEENYYNQGFLDLLCLVDPDVSGVDFARGDE